MLKDIKEYAVRAEEIIDEIYLSYEDIGYGLPDFIEDADIGYEISSAKNDIEEACCMIKEAIEKLSSLEYNIPELAKNLINCYEASTNQLYEVYQYFNDNEYDDSDEYMDELLNILRESEEWEPIVRKYEE